MRLRFASGPGCWNQRGWIHNCFRRLGSLLYVEAGSWRVMARHGKVLSVQCMSYVQSADATADWGVRERPMRMPEGVERQAVGRIIGLASGHVNRTKNGHEIENETSKKSFLGLDAEAPALSDESFSAKALQNNGFAAL